MKIRILFLSLLCAVAAVPSTRAADKEDTTVLGDHMDKMGAAFRKLRKQIDDATKNADSIALVDTMKKEATAASKEKPAWHPDDAAKYAAKMKEFIAKIDDLSAALKAGKNDVAAKLVGEIAQAQKEGHKEFKKPEKKKG
jgi:soluble cytochrome b562